MNTKPVMEMRAAILSYVLLLATPLFARESTDVVVEGGPPAKQAAVPMKTKDGSVYTGTLDTADTPGSRPVELKVAETSGKETVIDSFRIVQMDMTSPKFFQRFNGSLNTGIICSKGNQSAQYSVGSQVTYPGERWAAGASFSSALSTSTGVTASTRNQLDLDALHLMPWNNWFYEGLGTFLQSSEQGILRQTTFGGGVGRY